MIIKAPAKINLGLKINYRRPDGYHDIESVMQQIGLCDYLLLQENCNNDAVEVNCIGLDIPLQSNLVYKAALELQKRYGLSNGIKIVLYKNIPVGAGLAGGSTDAAATLLALNKLWKIDLPLDELLKVAEMLGADVSFCLLGGTALAKGKGERITQLPRLPFFGLVLAKPSGLSLSTEEIYGRYTHDVHETGLAYDYLISSIEEGEKSLVLEWMEQQKTLNMLEKVVLKHNQSVARLKESFIKLDLFPVMSGSGPSVFALTTCLKTAWEAAFCLEQEGYQSWASWTL